MRFPGFKTRKSGFRGLKHGNQPIRRKAYLPTEGLLTDGRLTYRRPNYKPTGNQLVRLRIIYTPRVATENKASHFTPHLPSSLLTCDLVSLTLPLLTLLHFHFLQVMMPVASRSNPYTILYTLILIKSILYILLLTFY